MEICLREVGNQASYWLQTWLAFGFLCLSSNLHFVTKWWRKFAIWNFTNSAQSLTPDIILRKSYKSLWFCMQFLSLLYPGASRRKKAGDSACNFLVVANVIGLNLMCKIHWSVLTLSDSRFLSLLSFLELFHVLSDI